MKAQFLFSFVAVLLAGSGVMASGRFTDAFFPAGDSSCSRSTISAPCTVGTALFCKSGSAQYYYKINGVGQCLPLKKPNE